MTKTEIIVDKLLARIAEESNKSIEQVKSMLAGDPDEILDSNYLEDSARELWPYLSIESRAIAWLSMSVIADFRESLWE